MQINGLGDMAKAYAMQNRNTALQQDIGRLTKELSTGQIANVRKAVTGKTAYINDVARSLSKLDAYDTTTIEATQFATGVQTALERVNATSNDFIATLLSGANAGASDAASRIGPEAQDALRSIVGALNSNISGRAVFSGTGVDTRPLVDADTLTAALRGAVAGAGSIDDMIAAAVNWFDDPAGFATIAYRGADQSLEAVALSETQSVRFDIRADDPVLRATLRSVALAALADDAALGLSDTQKAELFQKTTEPLLEANDGVVDLQARTGFNEGLIEAERTRNSAERTSLEMARAKVMSADPYRAATELEQAQFQLQSLYAVTSRMSQLSLVNFL